MCLTIIGVSNDNKKKINVIFAAYFQSLFDARFSDNPQTKVKEEATYVHFMDFIEECEGIC